ncbi:MAG: glycosyltransferase [Chitinophagaceae bacterium]|nr:glycosyltransferase [Chitinophagaceae bacterium]
MKVIIHQGNGFLTKDKTPGNFIFSTITQMCETHAKHEFIWLSYGNAPVNIQTAKHIILKPPVTASLWKQAWYKQRLASVIQKERPSCIFCINGNSIQTKNNIPRCVLITRESNKGAGNRQAGVYFITLSAYLKQQLTEKGIDPGSIHVIRPQASECFVSADWDTHESIKKKYAGGAEYFLFPAYNTTDEQVVNVLKAFSLFRKWQKSNTRLLIYTGDGSASPRWEKSLVSYKFRDDVVVQGPVPEEERALITACAMCMLYFPRYDATGIALLECLRVHVPAITRHTGAIPETVDDAALYADGNDVEDIAGKMKKLYRDEKLRTQLMSRITEKAAASNNNHAAEQWWAVIQQVSLQNHR